MTSDLSTTVPYPPEGPESQRRIDRYRLLQKIGEGGMGEVYEAEQEQPVRRRIALKLIKRGHDTQDVIARFESERQALALMDHPHIARVFDAGSTAEGLPYFVMELVQGIPITEHCDRHRLTLRERLALFLEVCDGVQHAHQKAIIHRDLKPSNILVSYNNGKAIAKIIDFGVAKAISQPLSEHTVYTELGQLIGSPGYMSPEQAEMSGQNIDTRTDVYSLGAVLYELLAGVQIFTPEALRSAGFDGMRRMIRDQNPKRPSTRVESLGETLSTCARNRQLPPRVLASALRGDLDWITMKALDKDRTRRYGSPSELAADLRRYLDHEPVLARPPSTTYRLRKFVRRHRVGVASFATIFLLLSALAVTMTVQARRIARERDRAVEAEASSQAINDFLVKDMLAMASPGRALGREVTVKEVLEQAARRVGTAFQDQPTLEVPVRLTLGGIQNSLGRLDEAEQQVAAALATAQAAFGDDDPRTLRALRARALVLKGRGLYAEAEPLLRTVLAKQRHLLGDGAPHTIETIVDLAGLLSRREATRQERQEAGRLYREALDASRAMHGEDERTSVTILANYASYLFYTDSPDAEAYLQEAAERTRRVLGDEDVVTVFAWEQLGYHYGMSGRSAEAEQATRRALASTQLVYGDHHPRTLQTTAVLGDWLAELERPLEAEQMKREAWEGWKDLPQQTPRFFFASEYAERLILDGKPAAAEDVARSELAIPDSMLGSDDPYRLQLTASLGWALRELGRRSEAETCYRRVFEGRRRVLGPEHMYTLRVQAQLGNVVSLLGRHEEGEALVREALQTGLRVIPAGWDGDGQKALINDYLGQVLLRRGQPEAAEKHLREAVALYGKYPVERPLTAESEIRLAQVLIELDRGVEALQLLESCWPPICRNRGAAYAVRKLGQQLLEGLASHEETRESAQALLDSACL